MSGPIAVPLGIFAFFVENTAARICLAMTAIACFVFASYWVWRIERLRVKDLEARLTPKLDILFRDHAPFIHKTFFTLGQADVLYVAVRPIAVTPEPVKNCVGYLSAVFKLDPDNATWLPTSFSMRQQLEWGAVGYGKLDIDQDTIQLLNVFRVAQNDPRLCPVVEKPLNENVSLFNNLAAVFRFDIVVRGDGAPAAKLSLRAALSAAWDDVQVSLI